MGQKIPIHLSIGVDHFLIDPEAVVVDHHADPPAGVAAALFADIPDCLHVLGNAHIHALEIQEQNVSFGIVSDSFRQRQVEQFRGQIHRLRAEDARVHDGVLADYRLEVHVWQDVPGDIDAGSNLDQRQAAAHPAEHATLGDVVDRLAAVVGVLSVEGDLLDLLQELPLLAIFQDAELAVLHCHLQAGAGEGADKHHEPRILADIDETACPGEPAAKAADVDVARGIALRHAEAGHVEAAAVVEVELLVLVDHRIHVDAGAEVAAARRNATDYAGLYGQGQQVGDLLFVGHRRHAFGHADTKVDDAVWWQLEGGAASDDLARVDGGRHNAGARDAELAGVGPVVLRGERLPVVVRLGDHDAIH